MTFLGLTLGIVFVLGEQLFLRHFLWISDWITLQQITRLVISISNIFTIMMKRKAQPSGSYHDVCEMSMQ